MSKILKENERKREAKRKQEKDKKRESRIVWRKDPSDLSGKWTGITYCFRNRHEVFLNITKKNGGEYEGIISINGGAPSKLENVGIRISYLSEDKYYIKDEILMSFIDSETKIRHRENGGGSIMTVNTKQICTSMDLVRLNEIPELQKNKNSKGSRYSNTHNRCRQSYFWIMRTNWSINDLWDVKERYPEVLGSFNPSNHFYKILFNDDIIKFHFNNRLSNLSDKSVAMLLEHFGLCMSYSARQKQIEHELGSHLLTSLSLKQIRTYNQEQIDRNKRFDKFIKQAVSMEDSLANVRPFRALLNQYAVELVGLPDKKYIDYLKAMSERASNMKIAAAFYKKHGVMPLLPLSSEKANEVKPNDATLPILTPEEIKEQESVEDIKI